jgi:septal ring factor EnvC (AmiA/AmiB activator)
MSHATPSPDAPQSQTSFPREQPGKVANRPVSRILAGLFLVVCVLFIGYQQIQINRLSNELTTLRKDLRNVEMLDRLNTLEAQLQALNARLNYLDSKIVTTDRKAQTAMDTIKTNEEKADWFGNLLRGLGFK